MHIPVLLKETIDGLQIQKGDIVVDATLGGGGFFKQACDTFGENITIIGLDADSDAVTRVKDTMKDLDCKMIFKVCNFSDVKEVLNRLGYEKVEKVAFDLGLSSFQIDDSGRGFTFQKNEPLRMTFSKEATKDEVTAEDIVNTWGEEVLKTIISVYGDEVYAGRISKGLVDARKKGRIETTSDLVRVIEDSVPRGYKKGRINPATKTFQALRMAVNDEITALEKGLEGSFEKIAVGGRIAVISFHSLEDRVVKRFFVTKEKEGLAVRVTKKPIRPTREEVLNNRRSRSAKLRILEKTN